MRFDDVSPRTSTDPLKAIAFTRPRHADEAGTPREPTPGCASTLHTVPLPAAVRMIPDSLDTYRRRENVDS